MAKYIFLLLVQFFLAGVANAQQVEAVTDSVLQEKPTTDSSFYIEDEEEIYQVSDSFLYANNATVSADTLHALKRNKKFAYVKNLDSLLKAYQKKHEETNAKNTNRVFNTGGVSFMDKVLSSTFFKTLLWILAAGFILIVIFRLIKGNGLFQKETLKSSAVQSASEEEALMVQDNFDVLIAQAVADKDYRLAVRYHFIQILQTLWRRNHIQYEADKTNSRYVYEIPPQFRNDFSKLIFQYEYVWYGHFDIDHARYAGISEGFNHFNKKI